MSDMYGNGAQTSLVAMSTKKLLLVVVFGAIAGLATWGLTLLLDTYIYKAILCSHNSAAQCTTSYQYAAVTAAVIGAAVGLLGLVRLHVFRPLLIIIAAFISLWGLLTLLPAMTWYTAALAVAGLYGFAFGLFAWLARIRTFYIAIIVMIITLIVVRLVLNS